MVVVAKNKVSEWQTYRTRFLIRAVQLEDGMSFTDALGREHHGRKGDYLVESIEGVRSIAPRKVFEDVYVAITAAEGRAAKIALGEGGERRRKVRAAQIHQQMALLDGSQPEIRIAATSSEAEALPPKKKAQRAGKERQAGVNIRSASRAG